MQYIYIHHIMIHRTYIFIPLLMLLSSISIPAQAGPEWVLQSEKDGIRIFTRDVEGTRYKNVRGIADIQAPKDQVLRVLTDFDNFHLWNEHITESHKISSPDDTTHLVYTMEDAPWPVQDRYHVSRYTISDSELECLINFESIPDFLEKRSDAIEMKRQKGFWRITSNENGGCRVEFFMDRNPGGYVPAWLVNYMIVETPFKTLHKLLELIRNQPRP